MRKNLDEIAFLAIIYGLMIGLMILGIWIICHGCVIVIGWILPAKIQGLYGFELGEPYERSSIVAAYPNFGEESARDPWSLPPTISGRHDSYDGKPYKDISVYTLAKTKRVHTIVAVSRCSLEDLLSLVEEKYGIEPDECNIDNDIRFFNHTTGKYYRFKDWRSSREIHVWQSSDGVRICAIDKDLSYLESKERRETRLDEL